jgi:Tol biopolymer transport system component
MTSVSTLWWAQRSSPSADVFGAPQQVTLDGSPLEGAAHPSLTADATAIYYEADTPQTQRVARATAVAGTPGAFQNAKQLGINYALEPSIASDESKLYFDTGLFVFSTSIVGGDVATMGTLVAETRPERTNQSPYYDENPSITSDGTTLLFDGTRATTAGLDMFIVELGGGCTPTP